MVDDTSSVVGQDLGVFIPAPMSQGMRMDFFLESPFMPNRMKLDRETLGGLADMFGQMPGVHFVLHAMFTFHYMLKLDLSI